MISIIDHGQGNIGSLTNALRLLKFDFNVVTNYEQGRASKELKGFILPGVGAFNTAMRSMRRKGLDKLVLDYHRKNVKGLGICLGMQLLFEGSEEGGYSEDGLKIFNGKIKKLNEAKDVVPNIGWVKTLATQSTKVNAFSQYLDGSFYYIHSYGLIDSQNKSIIAEILHGEDQVAAAVYDGIVLGVQFHPEKSQDNGLSLLLNYFKEQ